MRTTTMFLVVYLGAFLATSAQAEDRSAIDVVALVERAHRHWSKGEYQLAIERFTAALNLAPQSSELLACRGACYLQLADWDRALVDLNQAIGLRPKDAALFDLRSKCWIGKGELAKAISDVSTAIEINPKDADLFSLRSRYWVRKGDFSKALIDASMAIDLNPKDAKLFFFRATCWEGKGDLTKAVSDLSAAIELNPREARFYVFKGLLESEKVQHAQALADFESAVRVSPLDARANEMLVWTLATSPLERVRDGARAVRHGREFLKHSTNPSPGLRRAVAAALAESGQFEEAVRYLETVAADEMHVEDVRELNAALLVLFRNRQPYHESLQSK